MSLQTVARRYATALADVAVERGEAREVQEELTSWASMIQANSLLREVFANPTVPYDQKRNVLNELIIRTVTRQTTANFLQVLLRNQRLTDLAEVNQRLSHVLDERAGVVTAQLLSARPISDDTKESLRERLRRVTGQKVQISFSTDPDIIGGLVTQIGSTVFDGSIRSQLELLEKKMVRG